MNGHEEDFGHGFVSESESAHMIFWDLGHWFGLGHDFGHELGQNHDFGHGLGHGHISDTRLRPSLLVAPKLSFLLANPNKY